MEKTEKGLTHVRRKQIYKQKNVRLIGHRKRQTGSKVTGKLSTCHCCGHSQYQNCVLPHMDQSLIRNILGYDYFFQVFFHYLHYRHHYQCQWNIAAKSTVSHRSYNGWLSVCQERRSKLLPAGISTPNSRNTMG